MKSHRISRFLLIVFVMVVCMFNVNMVNADDDGSSSSGSHDMGTGINPPIYELNYSCNSCGKLCYTVCANSPMLSTADSGYHKSGTCYMRVYKSYAHIVCASCGARRYMKVDGVAAKHYCYESHSSCSKGAYYDTCPIDGLNFTS